MDNFITRGGKKILSENKESQVQSFLLRMAPGAVIPPHEHILDEECFMLEGEFMIGDVYLSQGDYHLARKGSKHGIASTQTGGLAFLRAYGPMD